MGGINCPPGKIGDGSSEMRDEYTKQLAGYSRALFLGNSSFFAANAKIEESILGDGNIDEALTLLGDSQQLFRDAQSQLGTVSSLYEAMTGEPVDFTTQIEDPGEVASMIETSKLDLSVLTDSASLQESIWSHPGITENLVSIAEKTMTVTSWQTKFATNTSQVAFVA